MPRDSDARGLERLWSGLVEVGQPAEQISFSFNV